MKQKSYTKVCQEKPKTMCDEAYRSKNTKTCYYRFFLQIIIIHILYVNRFTCIFITNTTILLYTSFQWFFFVTKKIYFSTTKRLTHERFVRLITGTPLICVVKHLHPRGAIMVLRPICQSVRVRPLPWEYTSFWVRH